MSGRVSMKDFCERIGIDPSVVEDELGKVVPGWALLGGFNRTDEPSRWVAYKVDRFCCVRFDIHERPIDDRLTENVEFVADTLAEILDAIIAAYPKAQPEPDLFYHVVKNGHAYVLKYPYLNFDSVGEDEAGVTPLRQRRVIEAARKYKRIVTDRRLARDLADRAVQGIRVGGIDYNGIGTYVYATSKNYKKPVLAYDLANLAEVLAVEIQKMFGDAGCFINWFGAAPRASAAGITTKRRPNKSEYAQFIVTGMGIAKKLKADVKPVIVRLNEMPFESLLKEKDENLRRLGELIRKSRR